MEKHIFYKLMTCCEARDDTITGGLSIRCPSAKSTKEVEKLPITTKYGFTNTKNDGNISARKYLRNLSKKQILGVITENEPAIGPAFRN